MKTVFVVMCARFLHHGHINIIQEARRLGDVTVGLATDGFNARYKRLSVLTYEQRKVIVENIKGVRRVIPQDSLDLTPVLRELRPDYVVHGDDWRGGPLRGVRQQVIEVLAEWGGTLVEPPYTEGISSTRLDEAWRSRGTTPARRLQHFRRLLAHQPLVRILEVHSGLSGRIAEHARVRQGGTVREFDAMWLGRRTDALARGRPPKSEVDLTARVATLHDILQATTKPLVVELASGARRAPLVDGVRTLERLGVSAVVLNEEERTATASDPAPLRRALQAGKQAQMTEDFCLIAALGDLHGHARAEGAIERARAYLEAGADAVMVTCQAGTHREFLEFCRRYRSQPRRAPLLATRLDDSLGESQLVEAGVQVVVYPDHLLRAAYTTMRRAAHLLLGRHGSTAPDPFGDPLHEIGDLAAPIPAHGPPR